MIGFGLIGYPLSHSFSKQYFREKFDREGITNCYYENFPLENIDQLPDIIANHPELCGLNVTIPYKESVMGFLDDLETDAAQIGAVNTIKIISTDDRKGRLLGFNTDAYGFLESIRPVLRPVHQKALILGTGGASKAVHFALQSNGIQTVFVSRTPRQKDHIGYVDITRELLSDFLIVINTSPLGMFPDISSYPPVPYHCLTEEHVLFDLVYNPAETQFLAKGREHGCVTLNGLDMLRFQAEKAWEIWNSEQLAVNSEE